MFGIDPGMGLKAFTEGAVPDYEQLSDGEKWYLCGEDYVACCDCGLVHRIKTGKDKNGKYIRVWRDKKRTKEWRLALEKQRKNKGNEGMR